MKFAEILATLPSAAHLQRIELTDSTGAVQTIENQPGSQGSLKVYFHLYQKYGKIHREAAQEGLRLYAEHTDDARANPGKHPNIDRLLEIGAGAEELAVTVVQAAV